MGTIIEPKLTSQDRKQAQTPVDTIVGLLHVHQYDKVIMPKPSTYNDPNEIAQDIPDYARNN